MPSASTSPKFPSAGEMMSQASGFSNNHTAIQHHDHQLHHEHEHVTERTPLRTRTAVHDHHHYGITIKERQSSEGEDSSVEEQESRALLDSSAHDDTAELSEEERGSLSDSSLQLQKRSKLAAAYRMKVRRTPMVARRRVLRFKRVKRHQAKGRQLATITDQDDELYDSRKESTMYRLSAFCTCEELNFDAIIHFFESRHDHAFAEGQLILYEDVLHIKLKDEQKDVFLFDYGAVVFFNFTLEEEKEFHALMVPYQRAPLSVVEAEDFDFCYGSESLVLNDQITLMTHLTLEKLSIAFALAQCVKLSVFEERVAKEIEANAPLADLLAKTGSIGLSRTEISKKIGKLFKERNLINLHFDILSSPDALWEDDRFKPVYDRLHHYLELGQRVDVLNKQLDIMKEMLDMLNEQLGSQHASKLEWIIIWLIVFEVVVLVIWNMLFKDILGFFHHSSSGPR